MDCGIYSRSKSNMDDCTQEAMLWCMHVLSIVTAQETDLNAKSFSGLCNTLEGQAAMPRSMREPSITAVGPIITERLA